MSSQKTENLKLHRWEGEDKFLRTEMNENFSVLDSAVAENAAKAAADLAAAREAVTAEISAASAALDGKISANATTTANSLAASINAVSAVANGKIALVTGVCTGNGAETQTISLGFTPKAVLLMAYTGETRNSSICSGGLALPGNPVIFLDQNAVEIVTNGFNIAYFYQVSNQIVANKTGQISYFLAFA